MEGRERVLSAVSPGQHPVCPMLSMPWPLDNDSSSKPLGEISRGRVSAGPGGAFAMTVREKTPGKCVLQERKIAGTQSQHEHSWRNSAKPGEQPCGGVSLWVEKCTLGGKAAGSWAWETPARGRITLCYGQNVCALPRGPPPPPCIC